MVVYRQKKAPQWLWWVEDSSNGQIVAFTFGRKTNATFRRLKKMLVGAGVSVTRWITDQWIAYQDCLMPQERIASKAELQSRAKASHTSNQNKKIDAKNHLFL